MLTRQGWLVVGGGLLLLVLGRILGIPELYLFGACALGLVVIAAVYVALRQLDLEVDRAVHPARVHAGSVSRVDLRIRNLRASDTPVLRLTDPVSGTPGADLLVPPLDSGAAAVASYRLPTDRRGLLRVGPLGVVVTDPFGLAQATVEAAPQVEVTVYPGVVDVRPVPFTAGQDPVASVLEPHSLGRVGDDFYALRPYVVGDDLRRIHWPSTARHDELLVRQHEQPWQGRTTVLLDVRRATYDSASFETAVSVAASIVVANSARRDLVRVVTTDGTDSGFGLGHGHLESLLEHLAVVQPDSTASLRTMTEALHKSAGGGLVVVLAQATGNELAGIARLCRRFGLTTLVHVDRPGTGASRPVPSQGMPVVRAGSTAAFAGEWNRLMAAQRGDARMLSTVRGAR